MVHHCIQDRDAGTEEGQGRTPFQSEPTLAEQRPACQTHSHVIQDGEAVLPLSRTSNGTDCPSRTAAAAGLLRWSCTLRGETRRHNAVARKNRLVWVDGSQDL